MITLNSIHHYLKILHSKNNTSATNKKRKDIWDILQISGTLINLLLLGLITILLNNMNKNREIDATYVKLAADIVQKYDTNQSTIELKKWALNVLNKKSPIIIPPRLKAEILGIQIKSPAYRTGGGFGGDWGFINCKTNPEEYVLIIVDGLPCAVTPMELNLHTGPHRIEFQTELGDVIAKTEIFLKDYPVQVLTLDMHTKKIYVSRDTSKNSQ
jgi:hypothetical protein